MRMSPALVGLGLVLTLTAQAAAPAIFSPFAGHWTGTLEYKDYGGSGKHRQSHRTAWSSGMRDREGNCEV